MKRLVILTAAAIGLAGCPVTDTHTTPTPAETAKPTAASVVPAGVEHLSNPGWKDMETPTDMPDFDDAPGEKAVAAGKTTVQAEVDAACKAGTSVASVTAGKSRIGYVSYKNSELPVGGAFVDAGGHFFGGDNRVIAWVNVLSLDSGDPVRDRKLKKLFFEAESGGNAVIALDGKADKALPTEVGKSAKVTVTGTFRMHGEENDLSLPLNVTRTKNGWTAKLDGDVLLPFEPFGLIEPLKDLIASCNHKAMGTSAKLDITLELAPGCG